MDHRSHISGIKSIFPIYVNIASCSGNFYLYYHKKSLHEDEDLSTNTLFSEIEQSTLFTTLTNML